MSGSIRTTGKAHWCHRVLGESRKILSFCNRLKGLSNALTGKVRTGSNVSGNPTKLGPACHCKDTALVEATLRT